MCEDAGGEGGGGGCRGMGIGGEKGAGIEAGGIGGDDEHEAGGGREAGRDGNKGERKLFWGGRIEKKTRNV